MESELDYMIDRALSAYSSAEPLAGLDERVLNRIYTAEAGRRQFRPWQWTLAVVALAAIVVVAIALWPRHVPATKGAAFVAGILPPSRREPRLAPKRAVRIAVGRAPSPKSYPKQEQFPAPAPITAEERALLAFVEHHPAEARQVFADLRKQGDEPMEIQPIQIAPLQTDGVQ